MTAIRDVQMSPNLNSILWEKQAEWGRKVDELNRQTPRNREEFLIRDSKLQHARISYAYFADTFNRFKAYNLGDSINAIFDLKFPPEIVVGSGEYDLTVTWVEDRDRGYGYFKFTLLPLRNVACVSFWDGKSIDEPLMELWFMDIESIKFYFGIYVRLTNSKGETMEIRKCGIHSWQRRETASSDKILVPQEHDRDYSYRYYVSLIKPGYLCNCDRP